MKAYLIAQLQKHQITPTTLSKKLGLGPSALTKLLSSPKPNPTLKTMKLLADYFGCSLDELTGRSSHASCERLVWNHDLMCHTMNYTRSYVKDSAQPLSVEQMWGLVLEIYNYCLRQKKGEFDPAFGQ